MAPFLLLIALIAVSFPAGEAIIGPNGNKPCSEIDTDTEPFYQQGRVYAMVFDDHGHSPFNFYDQMSSDGGCILVTVSMTQQILNVTVACEGTEGSVADDLVCPTWQGTQQQWRASNVAVNRLFDHLTVEGCIQVNETHKIYGSLLVGQPVMTKKKLVTHLEAVEFSELRKCRCRFRNEFLMDFSDRQNVERSTLGYCYWQGRMQSWVTIYVSSVVGLFSIGLSAYVVIRLALCRIKASQRCGDDCGMS